MILQHFRFIFQVKHEFYRTFVCFNNTNTIILSIITYINKLVSSGFSANFYLIHFV